ncbi:hypothetical protein, partial [Rikenella microfusus]|uniref:hypothetical protein n=1 Tax=Rikenella microfusus TaxID=28139 RepID=UPI003AB8600A
PTRGKKRTIKSPAFSLALSSRVKAADPGMCDFPFRREAGPGNRIPGEFFAFFFSRPKKKVPRRHEASGEAGVLRYKRTKKNKCPSATDMRLNLG